MGMTDDISDGMLELMLYKFKKWLGSVPRELQNRKIEHKPYTGEQEDGKEEQGEERCYLKK